MTKTQDHTPLTWKALGIAFFVSALLGYLTGNFVFCGWLGGWEGWGVKMFDYFGIFGADHPGPFYPWHGINDPWCILVAAFWEWEMTFIILLAWILTFRDAQPHKRIVTLIFYLVSLAYLAAKIAFALQETDWDIPAAFFHEYLTLLFTIGAGIFIWRSVKRARSGKPVNRSRLDWDVLLSASFFCGLAYLINTANYKFFFYTIHTGYHADHPLGGIPITLLATVAYSLPMLLILYRIRVRRFSLRGFWLKAAFAVCLPGIVYLASTLTALLFIALNPGFHQDGNAVWINMFTWFLTSYMNMAVLLFTRRMSVFEKWLGK